MGTQPRILVVEDHADLAENLAEILAATGYLPVVAGSAEEALRCLEAPSLFCALVTDFRLPGRSGAGLIEEIRHRGFVFPALVMSAYTDEETISASRRAGASQVLAKPVEIERLLRTISGIIAGDPASLLQH